jgi:hypothetical protein
MVDRDMSYELDDAFAGRNAGELQEAEVVQTRTMRTPGLKSLTRPLYTAERIPATTPDTWDGGYTAATGLADMTLDVPVLGSLSVKSIAIGAVVGALALWAFKQKR